MQPIGEDITNNNEFDSNPLLSLDASATAGNIDLDTIAAVSPDSIVAQPGPDEISPVGRLDGASTANAPFSEKRAYAAEPSVPTEDNRLESNELETLEMRTTAPGLFASLETVSSLFEAGPGQDEMPPPSIEQTDLNDMDIAPNPSELPMHPPYVQQPMETAVAGFLPQVQPSTDFEETEDAQQYGRVDVVSMGIVGNPLQKSGRHTVITGRLADDNPFTHGVYNLGNKMVSAEMQNQSGSRDDASRKEYFQRDMDSFLKEIGKTTYKIPVIGGGPLDLYDLMREVLLLGGVANVVKKRAFRIVGQQLELPKSCTSAAYVLKNAYEKLLFHYEQKLVFNIYPENPNRTVNMKMMVSADKERERREAKNEAAAFANARKRGGGADAQSRRRASTRSRDDGSDATTPDPESRPAKRPRTGARLLASDDVVSTVPLRVPGPSAGELEFGRQSQSPPQPHQQMAAVPAPEAASAEHLIAQIEQYSEEERFELPGWAKKIATEKGYTALIRAVQALDARREGEDPFSLAHFQSGASDAHSVSSTTIASPRVFCMHDFLATGKIHVNP